MPSSKFLSPIYSFAILLKRRLLLGAAVFSAVVLFSHNVRAANNPVPFVDMVSPVSVHPGSTGVVLTLRGTGFVAGSQVLWNGTALTTTFVNAQQLNASVPDSFVAAVGLGSVLVSSPTPGGGKSSVTFVPVAAAEVTTSFPSTPTSSVNVGTMPQGLLTADFNSDGKLDLAVANMTDGTVSILLGDGHGGFATKSTLTGLSGANWLATGDFNEDGIPDLAVVNNGTNNVSIMLGNGDGTFTLKSSSPVGTLPFAITAGDFNGDGHLDLAVTNSTANTVTVLLGAGDGTFTSSGTLLVGNTPQVIVAGDFNEDGKLDLAVSNENASTISVLIGNGDGTFQSQATFPTGGTGYPIGLIAADYNGDGHLDLAPVNVSDVGILLGDGLGSFTLHANPATGTNYLIAGVAGDYNGDGKLDLVVSDQLAGQAFLLPGNGDGTFGAELTFTTPAGSFGVATADFNGDGALDLAISNGTANNVSIFLQLLPVTLNPTSLSFGNQPVNTSSASQAVTLTNISGSALTLTNIGFTGTDSLDFSQSNTCGASVANNATCTINVAFNPNASGARVATLTIVDSASNSPQTLALTGIGATAPSITSANNASFTIGSAGSFTVTTSGFPLPSFIESGSLPGGVTFTDNGDGTATLGGTPATGSGGTYLLTIVAHNGVGSDASQSFTLTVASSATIAEAFGASTIALNGTTSLTFTITNSNSATTLTGIAFTDSLPAGLVVATPSNLANTCSGTASAVAGSASGALSAGTLAASASCTVSFNVQGTTGGVKNNSVQVVSTQGGTGNTSNASITVVSPPVLIAAIGAASIPLNGTTTLSFTVQNNNTTSSVTGVAFTNTLPAGLVISTPNGLTGSCGGGSIVATAGSNVIGLSGSTLAQSSSCTFSVNVTGTVAGQQNDTTGAISSSGGTGSAATAGVAVVAPPVIAQVFSPTTISLNGTSTLTFTVTNPAANTVAETGVAFSGILPSGLVISTPNGLSNSCGGTAAAVAGSGGVSLTGGSIAVNASCTVVVNVTGAASGQYTNTSGPVSSTNGGTGSTASANLTVDMPPSISTAFGTASIGLGGSTFLSFTITNPNSVVALTGVAFTDNLPAGLVVATPNGLAGTCGSGSLIANAGSQSIILTGGTIATSGSCTLSLNVTAAAAGPQVNTTSSVSATNGGSGNAATASINILAPDLTLAKSHSGNFYQGQNGATYSLTVSNIGAGPTAGTITVTDTLPAGLTAASLAGTGWNCSLGTVTCTRNDALAPAASYPVITVTVNIAGNTASSVTNIAVVSGGGELNTANDAAADLTTVTLPPDFSLSLTSATATVRGGQQASYAISISPVNNVFNNPIVFTVSGLPAKATFVFNPTAVTPGASAKSATLEISTVVGDPYVAGNSRKGSAPLYAMLFPVAGLILSGFGFRDRRRKNGLLLAAALLLCGSLGIYGCVGAEKNFQNLGSPAGTYTVTITGTSGTLQHSTVVTLVVQP